MYNIEKVGDIRDTLVTIGASTACEVAVHKLMPTNHMSVGKKIGVEIITALACTGAVKVGHIVTDYISKTFSKTAKED